MDMKLRFRSRALEILLKFIRYGSILFGLYLTSLYSYLLFHSLVELFSIVVGCIIFVIAWNSRKRLDNNFFIFIGVASLFVSSLDLIHTLAYKGMGIFQGFDANLPTQLWIAARYLQSISFLIAPLFINKNFSGYTLVLVYSVATTAVIIAIYSGFFPDCYVEGTGLTPFKKTSEYIISVILLVSVLILHRNRNAFDEKVIRLLITAQMLTIGAEIAFTFYISVYGISNLIGHFFKLIAFYLIYIAIVETALDKPQRLLYRNLKQSEEALKDALEEVQQLAVTDSLTNLYNRRQFSKLAEIEVKRSCRYQRNLSLIILDIDNFKEINDTYGHIFGDNVLQEVSACCVKELRQGDIIGRFGGDEFVVVLPESDLASTTQAAERLRKRISKIAFESPQSTANVTISIGIAPLDKDDNEFDSLLFRADQALYASKQSGKNKISIG